MPNIIKTEEYDAVACHVPPFSICKSVLEVSEKAGNIPFIFIVGDPIGFRDENGGFTPEHKQLQQEIINKSSAFVTTRETYSRYYSKAFDIPLEKVVFFSDCYVEIDKSKPKNSSINTNSIMHWGSIAPWRPIDKFVKALDKFNQTNSHEKSLDFTIVGKVHDKQSRKELSNAYSQISYLDLIPYPQARLVAQTADFYMVSVSARHMDNIPSKLIDLMSFKRPILLLAHPESEAAKEVSRLGIGFVADPDDDSMILNAIINLILHKEYVLSRYEEIEISRCWSCLNVTYKFQRRLCNVLGWGD
ncbi:glycosyltransferase [Nodularia spumigena CS-591/12]|uniref:glycosyltransferase n=1 Tax=Nodularia spumigena TaxID=70799 RepID=UPI00232D39E1|nr:glycosyltransferase [Nodularia spumigena]MDB9304557.1 glycosyltransferase [Nodularia spumigena CS-591/12]